jgi:uncharacterized damage-inducible protein DinB
VRQDPQPEITNERETIDQYLDYQRETIGLKTEGLSKEQLGQRIATSDLTLAGILFHLALVEESWLEVRFLGLPERDEWRDVDWEADPNWEFRTALTMDPDDLRRRYRDACDRARRSAASATSLDQLSVVGRGNGSPFTLRWVLLHLIEETARHAGHADIVRETIDGATCHSLMAAVEGWPATEWLQPWTAPAVVDA